MAHPYGCRCPDCSALEADAQTAIAETCKGCGDYGPDCSCCSVCGAPPELQEQICTRACRGEHDPDFFSGCEVVR